MKRFILTLPLIFLSFFSFGQVAETFDEAKKQGVSPACDSIYHDAANVDSDKAVFKGSKQHELVKAYTDMLTDLRNYLNKNGFFWGKPTQYFNRIYFKADGSVVYYLYSFKPGTLAEQKEKEFKTTGKRIYKNV